MAHVRSLSQQWVGQKLCSSHTMELVEEVGGHSTQQEGLAADTRVRLWKPLDLY